MNQLRNTRRRDAFTLVEVLVALGILAILLVIIVVPLRLGFDTFHIGKARADTQSALQSTMTSIETDLRKAVYVFPNGKLKDVTDKEPYLDTGGANPVPLAPYFRSLIPTPLQGACDGSGNVQNWSNPARIDMVQVRYDASGDVLTPRKPSYTIVSYSARRQDVNQEYDPLDNPIVLYRDEYPAYGIYDDGTNPQEVRRFPATGADAEPVAGAVNAQIDFDRFSPGGAESLTACMATPDVVNRNARWLTHNVYGEANLEPLTKVTTPATFSATSSALYSHTLATPRGLALEASRAFRVTDPAPVPAVDYTTEAPYVPDTSFTCADTNNDGKIDRVTVSLGLASFDVGAQGDLKNNQPTGTRLRATRSIDLPNIITSNN